MDFLSVLTGQYSHVLNVNDCFEVLNLVVLQKNFEVASYYYLLQVSYIIEKLRFLLLPMLANVVNP